MHTHITRMRHSKEGVQGLVAAFDGGEGDVDGIPNKPLQEIVFNCIREVADRNLESYGCSWAMKELIVLRNFGISFFNQF